MIARVTSLDANEPNLNVRGFVQLRPGELVSLVEVAEMFGCTTKTLIANFIRPGYWTARAYDGKWIVETDSIFAWVREGGSDE